MLEQRDTGRPCLLLGLQSKTTKIDVASPTFANHSASVPETFVLESWSPANWIARPSCPANHRILPAVHAPVPKLNFLLTLNKQKPNEKAHKQKTKKLILNFHFLSGLMKANFYGYFILLTIINLIYYCRKFFFTSNIYSMAKIPTRFHLVSLEMFSFFKKHQ